MPVCGEHVGARWWLGRLSTCRKSTPGVIFPADIRTLFGAVNLLVDGMPEAISLSIVDHISDLLVCHHGRLDLRKNSHCMSQLAIMYHRYRDINNLVA